MSTFRRPWSLDEDLAFLEGRGLITSPFTADERLMAERCASAWYFFECQKELPGHWLKDSQAQLAVHLGIQKVRQLRGDLSGGGADGTSQPQDHKN